MGWRVTSRRGSGAERAAPAPPLRPAPVVAVAVSATRPEALAASARELAVAAERLASALDAVDPAGLAGARVAPPEPPDEPIQVRPGRARMRDSPLADLFRATT